MKVIVVGAGLSGSLLAQGLLHAGADVTVHEREPAIDERSQGYRIHIAPQGDLALRSCLPAELYDRAVATSGVHGSGAVTFLDPKLDVVRRLRFPEQEGDGSSGRHLIVDRVTLRRLMLTGLDVHHGSAFERYALLDDGRVRGFFGNGEVADADLLVAADGANSRVRAQLLPGAQLVDVGQDQIYGKTPLTRRVRDLAPPAALEGFSAVLGTDGRSMPMAAYRSRSGTGEDYLMWVVVFPPELRPAGLHDADGAGRQRIAAELVADWPPQLAEIIRHGDPASVHLTTVRSAKPVPHWDTVPVTLMGDAIHAMVPVGESAAVALRDAALLCHRIAERDTGHGGSLLDAVHDYEAEMLDYGFAAVEQSLRGV
ncbi:FAD-dependent oxidoreductase [Streptomyces odontomachi]|uniref:FAD-dependent oxidoreductase n=1 Tax=Streptomyces odontomachi TaxID=2944940 RepID=UPI002108C055|nr:NAD(P)/FAD-dependent oxidoreductase [Streptomyces sp. ODS25]